MTSLMDGDLGALTAVARLTAFVRHPVNVDLRSVPPCATSKLGFLNSHPATSVPFPFFFFIFFFSLSLFLPYVFI